MNNLLISTFSDHYEILLEILGFTNIDKINFFNNHEKYSSIKDYREKNNISDSKYIWCISTDLGKQFKEIEKRIKNLKNQYKNIYKESLNIKIIYIENIEDISDQESSIIYSNLIYLIVYLANFIKLKNRDYLESIFLNSNKTNKSNVKKTNKINNKINKNGKNNKNIDNNFNFNNDYSKYFDIENIFLCPTPGRKFMSSSLERASIYFGYDALFHIFQNYNNKKIKHILKKNKNYLVEQTDLLKNSFNDLSTLKKLDKTFINMFNVNVFDKYNGDFIYFNEDFISDFVLIDLKNVYKEFIENENIIVGIDSNTNFYNYLTKYQNKIRDTYHNFKSFLNTKEANNFRILYTLNINKVNYLKNKYIGNNIKNREKDLKLIKRLPKVDLHCHIGGILSIDDLIYLSKLYFKEFNNLSNFNINKEKSYPSEKEIIYKFLNEIEIYKKIKVIISEINLNKIYNNEYFNIYKNKIIESIYNFILENINFLNKKEYKKEKKFNIIIKDFFYILRELYNNFNRENKIKVRIEDFDPVIYFIYLFKNKKEFLEKIIFDRYLDENKFYKIGIDEYQQLGNIQGSSIYQSKKAIKLALKIFFEKLKEHNVKYIELRGSFYKYTKYYDEIEILKTVIKSIKNYAEPDILVKLIMIVNRESDSKSIKKALDFLQKLRKDYKESLEYIVGFDVAGNEKSKEAKELRSHFIDVMRECPHITIHAGETSSVDSIWQAVYYLNAERIGHGLKLDENINLKKKIRDRKIVIEMCPSSNYQIVGYKDYHILNKIYSEKMNYKDLNYKNINNKKIECKEINNKYINNKDKYKKFEFEENLKEYPLKNYLDYELKVTINTDNPGISLTSITEEYYKATRLTNNGLSLWDILLLIKNGFKGVFANYEEKQKLILKAEKEIIYILKEYLKAI